MTPFSVTLLLLSCAIDLAICFQVGRSGFYTKPQVIAQCAIVWLIPLFGPLLVWAFLRSQYHWQKLDTHFTGETYDGLAADAFDGSTHGDPGGDAGGP
jgi:hypothetical protein